MHLLPLTWLWWRLLQHLHIEWSLNPQYSYGYAVPFLCLYLLYRRRARPLPPSSTPLPSLAFPPALFWTCTLLFTLLYAATRLLQEANPDWRLVSWALALQVLAITYLLTRAEHRSPSPHQSLPPPLNPQPSTLNHSSPPSTLNPQPSTALPPSILLFFLVSVPWPTFLEQPLIQGLARANAAAAVELANLLGIPALRHGNLIEISSGAVGIDEACSGIRSFQASLMLALFFGEYFALPAARRVLCVLAGFTFSLLFNILRTTLLTCVAARLGLTALPKWHDPAGIAILLACFLCLALLARRLATSRPLPLLPPSASSVVNWFSPFKNQKSKIQNTLPSTLNPPLSTALPLVLLALTELGVEAWYRSHESTLPPPVTWTIALPRENPTLRQIPIPDNTRQLLRYDEALNATWQEPPGRACQALFLRWKPGRAAVHLAHSHTPEICLAAAGRSLVAKSGLDYVSVNGLRLPFRSYVADGDSSPLHVFYCLWDDRGLDRSFQTIAATYANRLAPVLAGRRNSGQRSLELALWGFDDDHQAEAEFQRQLKRLVRPTPTAANTTAGLAHYETHD